MHRNTNDRWQAIYDMPTQPLKKRRSKKTIVLTFITTSILLASTLVVIFYTPLAGSRQLIYSKQGNTPTPTPKPLIPTLEPSCQPIASSLFTASPTQSQPAPPMNSMQPCCITSRLRELPTSS